MRRPGARRLAVIGDGIVATHGLPAAGAIVLGRDAGCDVRIDDPSISRRHARLHLGDQLAVEDLRSRNGTFVAGGRLSEGASRAIACDELVVLGTVSVVVQQHVQLAPTRTLWGHGYFELRLTEECTRAARAGTTFGLLRVRCGGDAPDALLAMVRDIDVVGAYAPGEWELLLVDAEPAAAAELAERARTGLRGATVALAMFPADGRDAWALGATAAARLQDGPRPAVGMPGLAAVGPLSGVLALADRIAVGDISVLIVGETGVGKELVAERVHARSRRAAHRLVKLNCAAIPEHLLESELFGHERGAFTGASATKVGLLELADGGSVFLDEIGELSMTTQAKLLRVIEQREILRVGALQPRAIDVRFLAATHRDLEAGIAAGTVREDLYFRIAGATLPVPALRERVDEIVPLAEGFAARAAAELGWAAPRLEPAAQALLRAYRWPGNVRE
ncbi:MAG TPA: sigma 54-interacting transcriptional regulator, partial [Kofleriaceae bacterium]